MTPDEIIARQNAINDQTAGVNAALDRSEYETALAAAEGLREAAQALADLLAPVEA